MSLPLGRPLQYGSLCSPRTLLYKFRQPVQIHETTVPHLGIQDEPFEDESRAFGIPACVPGVFVPFLLIYLPGEILSCHPQSACVCVFPALHTYMCIRSTALRALALGGLG